MNPIHPKLSSTIDVASEAVTLRPVKTPEPIFSANVIPDIVEAMLSRPPSPSPPRHANQFARIGPRLPDQRLNDQDADQSADVNGRGGEDRLIERFL